jgi:hypothetical protein
VSRTGPLRGTILRLFCFLGDERILSKVAEANQYRRFRHGLEARYAVVDRGWGRLALSDNKKTKNQTAASSSRESDRAGVNRDVGHALRSVYAKTVSEDIPPELLDLLGKLS